MKRLPSISFVLRLLSFVVFILPALACSTSSLFPPRPRVEWNNGPNNVVIQASSGGGMLYEPNPMPAARLWGDGRLIWVVGDANGGRRGLIATRTPHPMRQLLQTLVDDAFS